MHNRDFFLAPNQATGRSAPDYGRTGFGQRHVSRINWSITLAIVFVTAMVVTVLACGKVGV